LLAREDFILQSNHEKRFCVTAKWVERSHSMQLSVYPHPFHGQRRANVIEASPKRYSPRPASLNRQEGLAGLYYLGQRLTPEFHLDA